MVTQYILILFVCIGSFSDKDSMTITNIPGFATRAQCAAAGKTAQNEFGGGTKRAEFVCVEQTK